MGTPMVSRMIRFLAPALGLLASACIQLPQFPDPPIVSQAVDPTSPAAPEVLRAAEAARVAEYPSWQDIPAYPRDVRSPAAWNASARAVMAAGDDIERWRKANPQELTDTEAFARAQRRAGRPLRPSPGPHA
jgi:hypothetical protein